jgi:hypothetical protein
MFAISVLRRFPIQRLIVLFCVATLGLGQLLCPAARVAVLAQAQTTDRVAINGTGPSDDLSRPPAAAQMRNCLSIKLAPMEMASLGPPDRGIVTECPSGISTALLHGLAPAVPTPPPRLA